MIIDLAVFVVMPHHIHGIVVIVDSSANAPVPPVGAHRASANPFAL